jgi:hypothetical protein
MSLKGHEQIVTTISNWFGEARFGGLILPDGWFGRPHDNLHSLTFVMARPAKVLLELDDQQLLVFTDLAIARVENSEIILEQFAQCVFDWQDYGSVIDSHVSVYKEGQVRFVP